MARVIMIIADYLIWIGVLFILRYLNLPIPLFFIELSLATVIIFTGIKILNFIMKDLEKK